MTTVISPLEKRPKKMASSQSAGSFADTPKDAMRILFVDDDPILREFAVVNLTGEETVVETAADGEAALEAIRQNAPDLVLLDLDMPRLDGFGALQALRGDPRTRALPVVVVTGREDIEAADRAYHAGATSFVVKPLNWRLLSHQVRYVRRMAQNAQRLAEQRALAAEQLAGLAREGANFIAQALAADPALRAAAVPFAKAADTALGKHETPRAA